MDPEFWARKWEKNEIGFHQPEGNRLFAKHFEALRLDEGARVFVPLCGKTRDIGWLLSNGHPVVGVELVEMAIRQLFADLQVEPEVASRGRLKHYRADGLDIFVGDLFDATRETLGPVDAVYDRAAYVALPEPMRARYAKHVPDITGNAPQLLLTFEYDQSLTAGPPFSVPDDEIRTNYGKTYEITLLERFALPTGLRNDVAATESVWRLAPKI